MKINDQIIKYVSGCMNEKEISGFEERLENDPNLKLELERYTKKFNYLKSLANVEAEPGYLNNLLPKVRRKIENRKKTYFVTGKKIALSFPVIIIAFVVFWQFTHTDKNGVEDINKIITGLNDSVKVDLLSSIIEADKNALIDSANEQTANQLLSEEISKVLLENNNFNNEALEYFENSEIITDMTEEEVNKIYENLINKKII